MADGDSSIGGGGHSGPLFLLDGSNVAYRAFFALPEGIATSGGFPTNGLYGFCSMVIKILAEYKPSAVIVAWDSREKTFRHHEFEEYKAQRKPMPEPLCEQWPYFAELAAAFGFVNLAVPGWEADDILATLARQAEAQGRDAFIVTGDRDALQLAGEHVRIMANTRGVTDVKIYDPAAVEERFGVPPRLIPDLIGLKGDTSDNIPGVPGIGEKTAAQLLQQFGSLEEVLSNIDQVSGAKRKELLTEHAEVALLSKRLASLEHDAPIDIDTAEVLPHHVQRDKLEELFSRFEFNTLMDRVEPLLGERAGEQQGAPPPTGAALAVTQVGGTKGRALDDLLDWSGPVGVAIEAVAAGCDLTLGASAGDATGGAVLPGSSALDDAPGALLRQSAAFGAGTAGLWVAQAGRAEPGGDNIAQAHSTDYASYTLARIDPAEIDPGRLRELLGRGRPVCHDFKSARALHGLADRVAHDTYLAAYLLAPGRREYRLEDLARETGVGMPAPAEGEALLSEAGISGGAAMAPAAAAAATAAAAVLPVAAAQERALREQGMWHLFEDIELPLTKVLIDMEQAGIFLDCYRLGEISGKTQDQMEELESAIYELAGEQFNLGSPQQLGRILFERLGLPRQRKTKTGYSTDAKTLEALRENHPVVAHLLNHRELSKLMSTYLVALPQVVDEHGRLHTTFNQTVAATGRLSSSDPNLQNIPVRTALGAQIRECFTAEPGKVLIVADYSQIELRIMAHLSGEEALLEAFRNGEDIHRRTAAEVFGLPEDQVDKTHRNYAKAVNFGIMYGISAFGLSQNLGIDRDEAAAYIARYFERLPRVKDFIESTVALARRQGYVATVFGRRRPIPELASGNYQERSLGERLAVNSVIQGSAADIIKVAMIRCHRRLGREFPNAKLVLQVHDELVFEVPQGDSDGVREAVLEEMVGAFSIEPPLGVDIGVGHDWLSAK